MLLGGLQHSEVGRTNAEVAGKLERPGNEDLSAGNRGDTSGCLPKMLGIHVKPHEHLSASFIAAKGAVFSRRAVISLTVASFGFGQSQPSG